MTHTCPICNQKLQSQEDLVKHMRKEHKDKVTLTILEHPLDPKKAKKNKPRTPVRSTTSSS